MGDVVHVNFGNEREWEETRAKTVSGFLTIGRLYGDDDELMKAKAARSSRTSRACKSPRDCRKA